MSFEISPSMAFATDLQNTSLGRTPALPRGQLISVLAVFPPRRFSSQGRRPQNGSASTVKLDYFIVRCGRWSNKLQNVGADASSVPSEASPAVATHQGDALVPCLGRVRERQLERSRWFHVDRMPSTTPRAKDLRLGRPGRRRPGLSGATLTRFFVREFRRISRRNSTMLKRFL